MGKIKILPPHEAQKIAAGEVVERPANVTKELIENSLDAGASTISLFIEDKQKQSIKIIDNGFGMSLEDARLCIQNHATSKLTSVNDLEAIATFGFRGEALASISCVSHMILTTKESTAAQGGIQLTIENGIIIDEQPISCNTGTTIEINDLFYNVPARKKFLKKRETERRAIQKFFIAFSLNNRSCNFSLYHNKKRVLHFPAVTTIKERIAQIFDIKLVKEMVPCSGENSSIKLKVSGYISRPTYSRYDRNQLLFFVNNRWIKNYKLSQAIIKGYANILPSRQYPATCIFIKIDPAQIDINIHPRKEEIQFLHPLKVERTIEKMVKQTLEQTFEQDLGKQPTNKYISNKSILYNFNTKQFVPKQFVPKQFVPNTFNSDQNIYKFKQKETTTSIPRPHIIKQNKPTKLSQITQIQDQLELQQNQKSTETPEYNYQLIGQIYNTYIIIQTDTGLIFIDQHAAHERILYEKFSQHFNDAETTQLIFPQLITLSQIDCEIFLPYLPFFTKNGIILEQFNDHQLTVKALPIYLKDTNIENLIKSAVGWINEYNNLDKQKFIKEINDKIHAMLACKAAIKAGDKLDEKQIHELIKILHVTTNKMTCPHGRPTTWRISKTEIEKKFQRNYLRKK